MTNFTDQRVANIQPAFVYAFEALQVEVAKFQSGLTADSEIGIYVNGADNVIHMNKMRRGGQMMVFEGVDNHGRAARIIQHYTQVNVQMVAVAKLDKTAKRIGL